jgi:hypothetical protein
MLNLFNREVMPTWKNYGKIITAPTAGQVLVSYPTVQIQTWIYGIFISVTEFNTFLLSWVCQNNTFYRLIPFGGLGMMQAIDYIPINEGFPADNKTVISITNVAPAASGEQYQAGLLIAESNVGVNS